MSGRTYRHTTNGTPITEETINELADEAERGYRPEQLQAQRRGRGRPPLGPAAKTTGSVRLEPALRARTAQQAAAEGVTVSEVIRKALHDYLASKQ